MASSLELNIRGMDCVDCARSLEDGVARLDGVAACAVSFATARMQVTGSVPRERIVACVEALGYGVSDERAGRTGRPRGVAWREALGRPRNLLTAAGIVFTSAAFLAGPLGAPAIAGPLLFALGGLAGLYQPVRSGWMALLGGRGLDINVLMTIAAVGAFAIGEYGEAATVIVLFNLGQALEGFTLDRARDGIRGLAELVPAQATVLRPCLDCAGHRGRTLPDGSGAYERGPCPWCETHEGLVAVGDLAIGDVVLVRAGERIPVDGSIAAGESLVNQAPLTGESVPVAKVTGDEVLAGTVCVDGALEIRVARLSRDNSLSRVMHLVEEAQARKSSVQRFVDRFARVYTPGVVACAVLIAVVPPLVFAQPFLDTPESRGWLYRALAWLVIACPCALVIAAPVTVVSAIAGLARRGVLVKGGAALEALGRARLVAFDKTGTLTHGRPEVSEARCADECCTERRSRDAAASCADCDDMLALAAAVERRSSHPLARALARASELRRLPSYSAQDVETLPGLGVRGTANGSQVVVGSHTLSHRLGLLENGFCQRVRDAEALGQSLVLVGQNGRLRGYVGLEDPPRTNAAAALADLRRAGIGHLVMLTGDNAVVAGSIGRALGIDDVRAGLLPEQKVAEVERLRARGPVAMVGDGVNDAPALAAADVGIAMGGGGTAQALETADVALMADDLSQLPVAIRQGRRALGTIRFNIAFTLVVKAAFLAAATLGGATLWMAVIADMGVSLFVTLNGMRLLGTSAASDYRWSRPTA